MGAAEGLDLADKLSVKIGYTVVSLQAVDSCVTKCHFPVGTSTHFLACLQSLIWDSRGTSKLVQDSQAEEYFPY